LFVVATPWPDGHCMIASCCFVDSTTKSLLWAIIYYRSFHVDELMHPKNDMHTQLLTDPGLASMHCAVRPKIFSGRLSTPPPYQHVHFLDIIKTSNCTLHLSRSCAFEGNIWNPLLRKEGSEIRFKPVLVRNDAKWLHPK